MTQVVWWEVETPEPEHYQRFHAAMWGWQFQRAFANTRLDAEYWIITSDSKGIGGLQRSAPSELRPQVGTRVYVEVDDLEGAMERVQQLGGRVERTRTELGGEDGRFATALDVCGVSFGMWTRT